MSIVGNGVRIIVYLDYGEAKNRCGDVADPHTCYHCDKHISEKHCPRPSAGLAEYKSRHELGDVIL